MTTTQQIQEQEQIVYDLHLEYLVINSKIRELQSQADEINRNKKRAELNIYSLKALETVKP